MKRMPPPPPAPASVLPVVEPRRADSGHGVAPKRVYSVAADPKPAAVVIHCSDPRFQVAFEQFLEHELGLAKGQYIPIIVGGGAGVLAHPQQLPKEFKFLKERFEFYREAFPTVRRIILVNHEDCHYYDSIRQKLLGFLGSKWQGPTV